MLHVEHKWIDKAAWGPGPWVDEPDWVQWLDDDTGMPCVMTRNMFGVWVGYVGLPESHRWFGQPRDEIKLSVHGGTTFAGEGDIDDEFTPVLMALCPYKRVWWVGIDFGHAPWDFLPALVAATPPEMAHARILHQGVYRDKAFAMAEVASIHNQAATVWRHYNETGGI